MLLPGRLHYIYYDSELLAPGYSSTVAAQRAGYTGYDSIYICIYGRAEREPTSCALWAYPARGGRLCIYIAWVRCSKPTTVTAVRGF